jgi:hypothetical protein
MSEISDEPKSGPSPLRPSLKAFTNLFARVSQGPDATQVTKPAEEAVRHDAPRTTSARKASRQPSGTKTNHNWVEVDLRCGKITAVGDPAVKTLLAVVVVVVCSRVFRLLLFAAFSLWGAAKLWLP